MDAPPINSRPAVPSQAPPPAPGPNLPANGNEIPLFLIPPQPADEHAGHGAGAGAHDHHGGGPAMPPATPPALPPVLPPGSDLPPTSDPSLPQPFGGGDTAKGGGATATGGGTVPEALRGLGARVQYNKPIHAGVAGANFSFPAPSKSDQKKGAPEVTWGKGWTATGNDTFKHTNGAVGRVHHRTRVAVGDPKKSRSVDTPFGRGKQLPDGSVVLVRNRKAFLLKKGAERPEPLREGTHTIGGMKIRIFTATIVAVKTPDGRDMRFDSRGNVISARTRAERLAAMGGGPAGGAAGADQCGDHGGPAKGGGPVKGGGPAMADLPPQGTPEDQIQRLTAQINELLASVMAGIGSGGLDQSQASGGGDTGFNGLPAGLQQALGAPTHVPHGDDH